VLSEYTGEIHITIIVDWNPITYLADHELTDTSLFLVTFLLYRFDHLLTFFINALPSKAIFQGKL